MQKDLTILSINIGHGMLLDDLLVYIESKMNTVSVFCFQEADGAAHHLLDELLRSNYRGYYAEKDAGAEFFSLATYVHRDFLTSETNTVLSNHVGAGLALTSTVQFEELSLDVTNVHGHPRPGHKLDTPVRIEQSQALIKSAQANEGLTIFTGDFNLMPDTLAVDLFVQNGYKNLIDDFNIPTTRNEVVWNKYPDNKQLYADYVFLKADDTLRYDFTVEDVIISDHLPLIVNVAMTHEKNEALDLAGAESSFV